MKHKGMRPHDIAILLKIITKGQEEWLMKDIAHELGISASEVSESFQRSAVAGLLSADKKRVQKTALLQFLEYGLPYVFPQRPGPLVAGIPTAYSAPPLVHQIQSTEPVVWPYVHGTVRGQSIEPLHPGLPAACLKDPQLHNLLALTDALRMGRQREKQKAVEELKQRL